jgi:hypothetical protein
MLEMTKKWHSPARGAKPNTDVASRKVADQRLGSRGEDVHAEAKKAWRMWLLI